DFHVTGVQTCALPIFRRDGVTTIDALAQGLSLGVVKGTVNVLGTEILNLSVLARALQTNGDANVLSTPNLMTLDNEEASIIVGQIGRASWRERGQVRE